MRSARNGFTLIELLIVVSILGIMAMIVVPHYVGAAGSSRGVALSDQVRIMREQFNVYRAQHQGKWPGIDYNGGVSGEPEFFAVQVTGYTDGKGNISYTPASGFPFGPYLPSVPANPISGLKTVAIDTGTGTPTPNDTTGWVYQPATGKLWANSTGSDTDGKAYFEY